MIMWIDWFLPPSLWSLVWVAIGSVAMYLAILIMARLSGVRSFAEMSAFDIAVTIAIGSLLATTIAAKTPPLSQGIVALVTLFAIQLTASQLRVRWFGATYLTDNAPILLMGPGGVMKPKGMKMARVTESDLRSHMRQANVLDATQIQAVVIEGTGQIHVLHSHGTARLDNPWVLRDVRDYDPDVA